MPGQIKRLIDLVIEKRTKGNKGLVYTTKAKLLIKGIDPDAYDENSADDPAVLEQLKGFALELGVLDVDDAKQTPEHAFALEDKKTDAIKKNVRSKTPEVQDGLERRKKMVEKAFNKLKKERDKKMMENEDNTEARPEVSSTEPVEEKKTGFIKRIFRLFS